MRFVILCLVERGEGRARCSSFIIADSRALGLEFRRSMRDMTGERIVHPSETPFQVEARA